LYTGKFITYILYIGESCESDSDLISKLERIFLA